MSKPYRAPKRRGPPPLFPGGRSISVKLGDRERALVRLYARAHMGVPPGGRHDTAAVLRVGLERLCAAFSQAQIDEEIAAERERESQERRGSDG